MALRNALGELGLDATLQKLVQVLERWRVPAVDGADRMRVIFDSTSIAYNVGSYWGNANTYPAWYSTGAPTSMDIREQQAIASVTNFNQVRQQRWVV